MIILLTTFIEQPIPENDFNHLLDALPVVMREEVLKYHKREDQQARLLSKILLGVAIKKYAAEGYSIAGIKYTKENRPYIEGDIDFSISHSGNCVGCCFAQGHKIGFDLEKIQSINYQDFSEHIHEREYLKISQSSDSLGTFFLFWTKMEAVIKADGRGLGAPMTQVVFQNDFSCSLEGKNWFTYQVELREGYVGHIAIDSIITKPIMTENYSIKDLLTFNFRKT